MKKQSLVLRYALGMFALTLVGQLYHSFSYSYYVDKEALISLSLATASKVIFILVDGVNDVIFGYLSEMKDRLSIITIREMIITKKVAMISPKMSTEVHSNKINQKKETVTFV